MAVYLVKNQQGEVVNLIEWDGLTDYQPGEGLALELQGGGDVGQGV